MLITLSTSEADRLFQQDSATERDGGFQSLIVGMQKRTNAATGDLTLTPTDLERIPKYAFDYKQGGWENTLIAIFTRHLGPNLGR